LTFKYIIYDEHISIIFNKGTILLAGYKK